ncbi:solute carrier family 35 member G1-like [Oppia nitens]|uniref:solute carrier family 35 member G1-like n=1 Tax=Oppia nitens TaxID=1686743 RepID=UPI0023DA2248|nr:solute carrier family 35 member G1-like [Oppia nitens]
MTSQSMTSSDHTLYDIPVPNDTKIQTEINGTKTVENSVRKKSIPERIPAFGIICALIGVSLFSVASLIVKLLGELHAIEILIIRCAIQFIPYFAITIYKRHSLFGQPGHRLSLGLRCISGTTSLVTLYIAYRMMPLSDATTIYMASPVFTTIFAYLLLKERVTLIQAITGIVNIVGVVIIAKPEFLFGADDNKDDDVKYDKRVIGIILSIVSAISTAYSFINLRKLRTTPVPVVIMWYSLTVVIAGCAILPVLDRWRMPTGSRAWLLLLAIGAAGIGNQLFQTLAFRYESPGPVSVTRSFQIVLAFVWEVSIFHNTVEWTSITGALLITGCVLCTALLKWYNENPEKF